jgi:hypothetical protein
MAKNSVVVSQQGIVSFFVDGVVVDVWSSNRPYIGIVLTHSTIKMK